MRQQESSKVKIQVFKISLLALTAISALLFAGACLAPHPKVANLPPKLEADDFQTAEGSLAVDVEYFNWNYFNDNVHLRVTGTVRNNTGEPQQSVTLYVTMTDENHRKIGYGSSRIAPTYLPPDATGTFEVTVMPKNSSNIKYLKLETNAQILK